MSIKTVSKYTGIPESTLKKWKSAGFLPPHRRVGRSKGHVFHRPDIDAWMEMRHFELTDDYVQLRRTKGNEAAWKIMLARLDNVRAKTQQVVDQELAR